MASLARILFLNHSIISSLIPSLPHRWMAYNDIARVIMWPIKRIIYAGSPTVCKSRWKSIGLYLMKSLKPSMSY